LINFVNSFDFSKTVDSLLGTLKQMQKKPNDPNSSKD